MNPDSEVLPPSFPPTPPSLDSVTFDVAGHRYEGEFDNERVWTTPDGDRLSLSFFLKPPDLPANTRNLFGLLAYYEERVANDPVKVVAFDVPWVDETPVVELILKLPQQPLGMTYLGSLTIPFLRCSYVVKLQCEERGITGMRETAALARALAAGHDTLPDSDDSQLDKDFPDHPVSRVRRWMLDLHRTILLHPDLKQEPAFPLLLKHYR